LSRVIDSSKLIGHTADWFGTLAGPGLGALISIKGPPTIGCNRVGSGLNYPNIQQKL
jgi:hypothetical protein